MNVAVTEALSLAITPPESLTVTVTVSVKLPHRLQLNSTSIVMLLIAGIIPVAELKTIDASPALALNVTGIDVLLVIMIVPTI